MTKILSRSFSDFGEPCLSKERNISDLNKSLFQDLIFLSSLWGWKLWDCLLLFATTIRDRDVVLDISLGLDFRGSSRTKGKVLFLGLVLRKKSLIVWYWLCALQASDVVASAPSLADDVTSTQPPSCPYCHCSCQHHAVSRHLYGIGISPQCEPPPSYADSQRDHAPPSTRDVTAWRQLSTASSNV